MGSCAGKDACHLADLHMQRTKASLVLSLDRLVSLRRFAPPSQRYHLSLARMSHRNNNGHVALNDYLFGPHHATLALLPVNDDRLALVQLWHYRRGDSLSRLTHHCRTLINTHCYRLSFASTLLCRTPRN